MGILQDVRYGIRVIVKNPGFTLAAIATLALGIGVNAAVFSLVNGILLQPLAYRDPERLVRLTEYYPKGAYAILHEQAKTMDVAAGWPGEEFNIAEPGQPTIRATGTMVSPNFFSVLGVDAEVGRVFQNGEDQPGRDQVVILSHGLWKDRFLGDASIVGRTITIEGEQREVIGVLPPNFRFLSTVESKLWIPLKLDPHAVNDYWGTGLPLVGRLRSGASSEQATSEVQGLIPQILSSCPFPRSPGWNQNSVAVSLRQDLVREISTKLYIFLGAVGLVLLMACANVANLLLARAVSRRKEMALRAALGASRSRMIRQLLTESVLLALVGGALGVLVGVQGFSLLKALLPGDTPRITEAAIDWRVLLFTTALSIFTGLIFGLVPALSSSKVDLMRSLNAGRQSSSGVRSSYLYNALTVIEVTFAVILVIGAGLLIKSLWLLTHINPGFNTKNIVSVQISPDKNFCQERQSCLAFYQELLQKTRSLPGVDGVAVVNALPLDMNFPVLPLSVDGYQPPGMNSPLFRTASVTPDFNQVLGIPILSGRGFNDYDREDTAGVALVSASTAKNFWPGQDPIGKRIKPVWDKEWRTIVGVTADVKLYGLDQNRPGYLAGEIYLPYTQAVSGRRKFPISMNLILHTSGDISAVGTPLRATVAGLNPNVPVGEVRTMESIIDSSVSVPNSTTRLFSVFSALALFLGAVGIYSVISFSVIERRREIGIRIAIGATSRDVLKLIIGKGMTLTIIGIVIGTAAALGLTRLLSTLLFGVKPFDLIIFVMVPFILAAIAFLASYIPARRATKIDPTTALKFE